MTLPDHAFAYRYAARLKHEYTYVAERALFAVHDRITQEVAWLLQHMQAAPLPPALIARFQELGVAPKRLTADAAESRIALLRQLVDEAAEFLTTSTTNLAQMGKRYDGIIQVLTQTAAKGDGLTEQTDELLASFNAGVRERLQSMVSRLAEARFTAADFTRLLTDELLAGHTLHRLLTEVLESAYQRQMRHWRETANRLHLRSDAAPQQPALDMDALLQTFLEPIQLVYERPNMLRSIAHALSRGRLYDKLTQEINMGLNNLTTYVTEQMRQLYDATEKEWSDLMRRTAAEWFSEQTGIQRDDLETRLSQWEEYKRMLQGWAERLQKITPAQVVRDWQPELTRQALHHLAERIAGDARR
jgi:hypothetical protein